MSNYETDLYLSGTVAGYQYHMHITITYAEECNRASMIVYNGRGLAVDRFTREFHHQYGRDHIKKSMRDTATNRDAIPELKGEPS